MEASPFEQCSLKVNALETPITTILNFSTNLATQEAVLESFFQARAHVPRYGEGGKKVKEALQILQDRWRMKANERTLSRWVRDLLASHEVEERRLDGETGTEYDRSDIEVNLFIFYLFFSERNVFILAGTNSSSLGYNG